MMMREGAPLENVTMKTEPNKALPDPDPHAELLDEDFVLRGGKNVTPEDVEQVQRKRHVIERIFGTNGVLSDFTARARLMLGMINDYARRRYKEVPSYALGAAVFSMLYVLAPADIVPDFLPGVGFLDDAGVVAACLKLLDKELQRYEAWAKVNVDTKAKPVE